MGPGEFFGELALIRHNSTRAADCVAVRTTKVRIQNWGGVSSEVATQMTAKPGHP